MIKKDFFCGFFGFLGFLSLRYFASGNISDLGAIGAFAFFSHFFIAKINGNKADERYIENCRKAKAFAFDVAMILIFCCWILMFYTNNLDFVYVLLPIIYAIIGNVYGIKLYILEEK